MPRQRSDSRASVISIGSITSQEVDSINSAAEQQLRARTGSRLHVYQIIKMCYSFSLVSFIDSPADLHGMWYPTVRRTLVCLSRLYRCVDRPIFQGLSQEALNFCIQSVSSADQQIAYRKTPIDGELFEIKHLLILREQIAPFRVDFTVKETHLDFTKVKTAAYGLLQNRKQLFSLGTNNALLEFLLDGTPQVKEHLHDSRKDVDRQLKTVCEQFIKDATRMLIGPVTNFLEKSQQLLKQSVVSAPPPPPINGAQSSAQPALPPKPTVNYTLRQTLWASPQHISGIIQETQRLIKSKLAELQRSMQLYLSNKDTEFILFRPIRNNIIGAFVKLEQILSSNGYTADDMTIASCPTADQISVLLSSASVLADNVGQAGVFLHGTATGPSYRRTSSSSTENDRIMRRISLDRRVTVDAPTPVQEAKNDEEMAAEMTADAEVV